LQLERKTLSSPVVEAAAQEYLPVRYDVDSPNGREAADHFQVVSLPTILIVGTDGKIVNRSTGYKTDQEVAAFLAGSKLTGIPVETLFDRASKPDADPALLVETSRELMDRGRDDEAKLLLERAAKNGAPGSEAVCRALMELAAIARRTDPALA